jgi:hypothetical protein
MQEIKEHLSKTLNKVEKAGKYQSIKYKVKFILNRQEKL